MTVDHADAWRHLLGIPPGEPGVSGPLTLAADGSWTSTDEATVDAKTTLDIFGSLRAREAWAVGQLGQSVDGRIATEDGHSHYINGPDDIRRLHRLRALAQAVVVGAGTVASDDPRLTVRHVEGENPVRVVLDPSGRLDASLTVFQDESAPTLWVQAAGRAGTDGGGAPSRDADRQMLGGHVEIIDLHVSSRIFDPHAVLSLLAERGLRRVLVEGGGLTVSAFLKAKALDRLHLSVAPLILGSGRPALTLPPIATLDEAIRPSCRHFNLGSDLLFDLELERLSV